MNKNENNLELSGFTCLSPSLSPLLPGEEHYGRTNLRLAWRRFRMQCTYVFCLVACASGRSQVLVFGSCCCVCLTSVTFVSPLLRLLGRRCFSLTAVACARPQLCCSVACAFDREQVLLYSRRCFCSAARAFVLSQVLLLDRGCFGLTAGDSVCMIVSVVPDSKY